MLITLAFVLAFIAFSTPAMANYAFDGWAPTTRTNGTINGTVFIDSVPWNGQTTLSGSFDVPAGTVKKAYLYSGIWGGSETYTGWVSVEFNGEELGPLHLEGENDQNPNVWCTGHGKYWWWYDVTNRTNAGQTNTATVSKINGTIDGRVYGIVLVVVLENDSLHPIQYWINDGSDALNYVTPHNEGTTYFNGTVDTANVTYAELTMVHLTGYDPVCSNCLKFNDNSLDTSMVDSNTFEINSWDVTNYVASSENDAWYTRCGDYPTCSDEQSDPYVNICNAILTLNDTGKDLVVTNIDIGTPRPNHDFTVYATIKNDGSENVGHFNVSLFVNGSFYAKNTSITGLNGGESTTVSFENVNLPKGCHEFRVFADSDNDISEDIESNNNMTINGQVGYVIVVKSDSDFENLVNESDNGLLGNGNVTKIGDTYYIRNFTGDSAIENCAGNGITIENTNAKFVITNCTILNCSGSGIYLHNLSNGTINGSEILNNSFYGIKVGEVPLSSEDPQFVNITNCTINGSKIDGIDLIGFNCTVSNNTITNSTTYGIYLLANDTNITYNTIQNNTDYGVKLYNSSDNYIYENEFIDNNASNSGHQAWDNRATNYWNTTELSKNYVGNRWKDWDDNSGFPSTYDIDGGTNKDKRPKGLYDFLTGAGTDKWAYEKEVSAKPPTSNGVPSTEFPTSTDYNKIKTDNEDYKQSDSATNGYYAAHRFNFSISESPSSITKINVTWNGKGWHEFVQSSDGANLYIWNFTLGEYELLHEGASTEDEVTLTGEKTSSIGNYINGGNVTVLVVQKSEDTRRKHSHIETDYVRVAIVDP